MSLSGFSPIAVTGCGVVSPLGHDPAELWENLVAGRSGIRRLEQVDIADLPCSLGGEVRSLDASVLKAHPQADPRRMDRASLFAVLAARRALLDARLPLHDLGPRVAVVLGAGLSGMLTLQQQTERLLASGPRSVSPLTIPLLMPNASAANVCLAFGVQGVSQTVSTACSSSGHAILDAARLLHTGAADVVLTGGTEAAITRLGISAFVRMGAMPKDEGGSPEEQLRPFDARRRGMLMSEGAAVLVLERPEDAARRGASPKGMLLGAAATTDAHHLVTPDPTGQGAAAAIRGAFASANVDLHAAAARTYVNAHGTGTQLNDAAETCALKTAFGPQARDLQISSTKSMTGHLIGAAGAIESVVCLEVLNAGIAPPTINLTSPDADCDLDYIPLTARRTTFDYALNDTFGFGGHNVSLLFGRARR